MPMSHLAEEIYRVLQPMVPAPNASITYTELVEAIGPLPPPNENLQARDPRLDEALGEIVHACFARDLPPLPAIVVNKSGERQGLPGSGYFIAAHPDMEDEMEQIVAWGNDVNAVRQREFPAVLVP